MASNIHFRFPVRALALAAIHATCLAQTPERITITGRLDDLSAGIAGFGDVPASKSPYQATVLTASTLADSGAATLADITRLDAGVNDAYNAPGYWSSLTVRGFVLDNNHNYLRDGLPISAETSIALENKDRIEVLKGTSGIQTGTSSPGGLANLVVKRPRGIDQASAFVGWSERGNWELAADVERQLGDSLGVRLNAAFESLDPLVHDLSGHRSVVALAATSRMGSDRRIEGEIEISHQSQPSMPGFSMLGGRVPSARDIDPRTNLNNQSWSLPVVFDGTTASLRWTESLDADWQAIGHVMTQQLHTDDRIAFPFGCSAENTFDRYCSDGTFDLYDYRSEGERRDSFAGALTLQGRLQTGAARHELSVGALWSDFRLHPNEQTYNLAGVGKIDGSPQVDAAPEPTYPTDGRHERSTELHWHDHVSWSTGTSLWLGLRHTRPDRGYSQSFTTPWLAISQEVSSSLLVYGSWGEGIDSEVVPSLPMYTNAGQVLPALRSKQFELGAKFSGKDWNANLTAFDIRRPMSSDVGTCDGSPGSCTRAMDGNERHRGVEGNAETRWGAWGLQGSVAWLRAQREGSSDPTLNGLTPPNVAQRNARLLATWQAAQWPGLALQASMHFEGPRFVLPDDSQRIPGWTAWGLGAKYSARAAGRDWLARIGVDNLFDRRAWRESPYQFEHVYLYPLEPRALRASLQVTL